MALKDDAGLVKKYAMVNVQKYQVVAIGNTVSECEENYNDLMYESGIKKQAEDTREVKDAGFQDHKDRTGRCRRRFSLLYHVGRL